MFSSNKLGFCSQERWKLLSTSVFKKECKYIEKKVVRHIPDNLSDFFFSDESDEELVKAIRLMIFENVFFEGAILKESNE